MKYISVFPVILYLKSLSKMQNRFIVLFLLCSLLLSLTACSTGDLLWKYRTNGAVMSGPAAGDGAVYFGSLRYVLAI